MTPVTRAWTIAAALVGALACVGAHAQRPVTEKRPVIDKRQVTEKQAASYIYFGFLTDAAHALLSKDVKLGPELRQRLALPQEADSRKIYDALVTLTDKKALVVRKAGPDELSRYAVGDLRQPLFALEAGNTTLLIQFDMRANNISFVGQLAGPAGPPKPIAAPKPAVAPLRVPRAEPLRPLRPLRPTGPCVVKPVMSDQDLVNCGATPR
jgi:hypothetical protein